jgi:hypothetical protein
MRAQLDGAKRRGPPVENREPESPVCRRQIGASLRDTVVLGQLPAPHKPPPRQSPTADDIWRMIQKRLS